MRGASHLLLYFPSGYNGQGWERQEPGDPSGCPMQVAHIHLPGHKQEAGLDMQQPGHPYGMPASQVVSLPIV